MELYKEIKTHAFNKTWEIATFSGNGRNAVVMTNGVDFAVGKDFILDDDGFTVWSWGTYGISNLYKAVEVAKKWVFG